MRVSGQPSEWNKDEGVTFVEIQTIAVHASADEFHKLAVFFQQAGEMVEHKNLRSIDIELPDSKPMPLVGIMFLAMPPSEQNLESKKNS